MALPHALAFEGLPPAPVEAGPVVALGAAGARGHACCRSGCSPSARRASPPASAGAFLNLEPLVGVAIGWIGFGETIAANQLLGGVAVLAGIALSTYEPGQERRRPRDGRPRCLAAPSADRGPLIVPHD